MCFLSVATDIVDEKRPLLTFEKRFRASMKSSSAAPPSSSSSPCRSNDCASVNPYLRRLLNRLSSLAAFVGISWFCVLLGLGEYFTWAAPLLVSASVCKLLTTAPTYDRQLGSEADRVSLAIIATTWCHRAERCICGNAVARTLSAICRSMRRRFDNDNRRNVFFLSFVVVITPCSAYFFGKAVPLLLSARADPGERLNHKKLANDFGKFGAAGLSFLLVPVSKHSSLFAALGWSEVHAVRLHIAAGCIVLFGGIGHGLYYTYIWIVLGGYSYDDVFPSGQCLGDSIMHREYDKGCHSKLVNLTGIVCGASMLALGVSSLYWVRRIFYRVFYSFHVMVSIILLFGLAMHYNKMIYYLSPSLLYYMGSNLPVHVESMCKWWRSRWHSGGGIGLSEAMCISDSGGCVELSFFRGVEGEGTAGVDSASKNRGNDFRVILDTVGKYIKLHVPELSLQSHPFTVFADPEGPSETIKVLFRPCGSFTTALSKRIRELALSPERTPSEIENHHRTFFPDGQNRLRSFINGRSENLCPTMLVNGIRSATSEMFAHAISHDRTLIFAGGVGIVSYISLIHALRLQCTSMMTELSYGKKSNGYEKGGSVMTFETYDTEESLEEGRTENEETNRSNIILGSAGASKRVDIHWMSRDEGLIRHVLQNYLAPYASVGDDGCACRSGSVLLSINVVVHHTSIQSPMVDSLPAILSPGNNSTNGDSEATTTWRPGRRRRPRADSPVAGEPTAHPDDDRYVRPSISLASAYEGRKASPLQNLLPTVTFASIAFGGLSVLDYCYDKVQDKHVAETRLIAVAGILALSLAAAMVSNAAVMAGEMLRSKWMSFVYFKLDENGDPGGVHNGGEIECGEVATNADSRTMHPLSIDGEDAATSNEDCNECPSDPLHPVLDPQSPSALSAGSQSTGKNDIIDISHVRGRPDLSMIVRDAMMEADQERKVLCEGGCTDLGILMCGPAAMCDSVWAAVREEEKGMWCCRESNGLSTLSIRKPVAVHQEVFEL